jgi:hypothetical protein
MFLALKAGDAALNIPAVVSRHGQRANWQYDDDGNL